MPTSKLTNAVIVPCVGDGRAFEGELVIDDERILEVSEGRASADADETRDLGGATVLPGFIDLHAHLTFRRVIGPTWDIIRDADAFNVIRSVRSALTLLRQGVTTIRELAAPNDINHYIKSAIDRGMMPGPRIVSAGTPLGVSGGHAKVIARMANGPEALRYEVRDAVDRGADWIKVITSNDPLHTPYGDEYSHPEVHEDELAAIVRTAHGLGRRVAVHVMGARTCEMAARVGVDTLEHGVYLDERGAAAMRESGSVLVPTLSGYLETTFDRWERGDAWIAKHEHLVDAHRESFALALDEDVPIAFGTDSVGELVHELELMHKYGMTIERCLEAATRNSARVLGLDDHLGSLEPGKIADLCIVNSDPLANVQALRDVAHVVQGGTWFEPLDIRLPSGDEGGDSEPWMDNVPAPVRPVPVPPLLRAPDSR